MMKAPATDAPDGSVMVPRMPPPNVCAQMTSAHTSLNKNNKRIVEQRLWVERKSNKRTDLFIGFRCRGVNPSRWDRSDSWRKSSDSATTPLLDSSLGAMRKFTGGHFRVISPRCALERIDSKGQVWLLCGNATFQVFWIRETGKCLLPG
jgi:hypothetical protein